MNITTNKQKLQEVIRKMVRTELTKKKPLTESDTEIGTISKLTATRPTAISKFISDNNLDISKLLKFLQTDFKSKSAFISAISGTDGNKFQKMIISKFKLAESVLTEENVESVAAKIADQTDSNDHTGAVVTLAEFLKNPKLLKCAQAVKTIHDIEGSLPDGIDVYRRYLSKKIQNAIANKFGDDVLQQLRSGM